MNTFFKVVALDDTINSDSSHYELEMDRERELKQMLRAVSNMVHTIYRRQT